MNDMKTAKPDYPIHEVLRKRWSPYGFSDREVVKEDLRSIFEGARWAPSSYNEQPWRFILALKSEGEAFAQMVSCLVEANQAWAAAAPVLVIACTSTVFSRNGAPNMAALHDLGLASASLSFEATTRGLCVHQMIGILPEKAREVYRIPAEFVPLTALAIGYAADPTTLPEKVRERDQAPRQRRPVRDSVFGSEWGKSGSLFS
jgi:nitroreductase